MKALILNSGLGSRMGDYTKTHPKCMTDLVNGQTIIEMQLRLLVNNGINEVVITTGYYDKVLEDYCKSLNLPIKFYFIKNPIYDQTNYIYSIYCAREILTDDDLILMHGDLVFEQCVLKKVIDNKRSCMVVSSTTPLPEKDFKAVISNDKILKVGIEFFENVITAQPLYKLNSCDWQIWLDKIIEFCENNQRKCYAENAFNQVSDKCNVYMLDVKNHLCVEVDTPSDLISVNNKLKNLLGV